MSAPGTEGEVVGVTHGTTRPPFVVAAAAPNKIEGCRCIEERPGTFAFRTALAQSPEVRS